MEASSNRALWWVLLIFGIGCAVSNSLMSVGGLLWGLYLVGQARLPNSRPILPGLLFCLWMLGVFLVLAPAQQRFGLLGTWAFFLFWVLSFSTLKNPWSASAVRKLSAVVGIAYVGLWSKAIYQKFYLGMDRVNGFHNNPNYLSAALLPALIYFGEVLVRDVKAHRATRRSVFASLALLALFVHVFLMAATRTIFPIVLLYLALIVVRLWPELRSKLGSRTTYLSLATLVVAGVFILTRSHVIDRFSWTKMIHDPAILSRFEIWKINWQFFLGSPWYGVGLRQNLVAVADYPSLQQYMIIGESGFLSHNTYLQILVENGLIGLLLFLIFLAVAWAKRPHLRWYLGAILIAGVGDTLLHMARAMPAWIFFLALANLSFASHPERTETPHA